MPNILPRLVLAASVTGLAITVSKAAYAASFVTSTALVNLLAGPDSKAISGANPIASSIAVTSDGKGLAFAQANGTSLRARAESNAVGLSFPSIANSSFANSYSLIGNPANITVPLTFNFSLSGQLKTSTSPGETNSIASAAFNYSLVNFDFLNASNTKEVKGEVIVTEQGGIPVYLFQEGTLGGEFFAEITPKISIGTETIQLPDELKQLLPESLTKILQPRVSIKDITERNSVIDGILANAINTLPSLIKFRGGNFKFSKDVTFVFDSKIQSTQIIQKDGRLDGYLYTSAASTPSPVAASAKSDFSQTLKLLSITVPENFDPADADVNDLKVLFESGETIPVTREFSATPVPTPAMLPGLIALGLSVLRQRRSSRT